MSTLTVRSIVLLLVLSVFSGGCTRSASDPDALRVGFFPNVTHAPALVGVADNFNSAVSDKTVTTRAFKTGPELMIALAAGEIDAAFVGPVPAMTSASRGIPVTIVSGVCSGGYSIVAANNSGINAIADLKGKVVAVPQYGNTQDVICREILRQAGLSIGNDGVTIAQCEPADSVVLLSSKRVSAVLMPEPWASVLIHRGAGYKVEIGAGNDSYPSTVLVFNSNYASQNPATVDELSTETQRLIRFVQNEPDDAIKIVSDVIKKITGKSLPDEVLKSAFRSCDFTPVLGPSQMESLAEVCIDRGYVPKDYNWVKTVKETALSREMAERRD